MMNKYTYNLAYLLTFYWSDSHIKPQEKNLHHYSESLFQVNALLQIHFKRSVNTQKTLLPRPDTICEPCLGYYFTMGGLQEGNLQRVLNILASEPQNSFI